MEEGGLPLLLLIIFELVLHAKHTTIAGDSNTNVLAKSNNLICLPIPTCI